MVTIGFDFDGTLAVWPRGVRVDYNDVEWAIAHAAAVPRAITWLREVLERGHTVLVITGRGDAHRESIREWIRMFTGFDVEVITRPPGVDLDTYSQSAWKSFILTTCNVDAYIGDNHAIDRQAARSAGVRFLDAARFFTGKLPPLPEALTVLNAGSSGAEGVNE